MGSALSSEVGATTYIGWGVIFGGLLFYTGYKWHQDQLVKQAKEAAQKRKQEERQGISAKKEIKAKRPRVEDSKRESYASKLKAQPPAPFPASNSSEDDDVDNREFARQLNSVKQGTKLATKTKQDTKQKTLKQSQAKDLSKPADAAVVSAPSSTAGIDADDDQSSVASPTVHAADPSGISDMLEKAAPGPSVLRLTDTEQKKPKEKKAKVEERAETKKQRQNRKKVEEAKIAREEAEKERKVKMEAQRRTARLAEGRAAKDGSAFMAAQQNQPNAWSGPTSQANGLSKDAEPLQLLDTFAAPQVAPKAKPAKKTNGTKTGDSDWQSGMPSEEEQMELLKQEEQWSEVKAKPRKTKKAESGAESTDEAPKPTKPAAFPAAKQPESKSAAVGGRPTKTFAQQSSFAALQVNGPEGDDDEEPEQEWDV